MHLTQSLCLISFQFLIYTLFMLIGQIYRYGGWEGELSSLDLFLYKFMLN